MHSMTLIIVLIARFLSFSEKKLLKSEIIVVPLLTALMFELYSSESTKLLIFSELNKYQDLYYLSYSGSLTAHIVKLWKKVELLQTGECQHSPSSFSTSDYSPW